MQETEIKLKYNSMYRNSLIKKCLEMGFERIDKRKEIDTYYNHTHKNLLLCDQALRIRNISSKDGKKCIVTFKGANKMQGLQCREELEMFVGDSKIFHNILEQLGFFVLLQVEKERLYLKRRNVQICVDEVVGLGSYFEIEILDKKTAIEDVWKLIKEINVIEAEIEKKTYLELILEK